jgi:uncharacterized membrane protein
MVLDFKVPADSSLASLCALAPVFFSYVLSYIYLGIYWNNHHHLMQAVHTVNGPTLWANLHLLFWLSMIPFVTAWTGQHHFEGPPVAIYGVVLFCAGTAYYILTRCLLAIHEKNSTLAKAVGRDGKGKISIVIYAVAIALALFHSWVACCLYVLVACLWLIPDRRIENILVETPSERRE